MKKYTAILMAIIIVSLTGCSSNSIVLTDSESDMIAEYMAGVLLKYDNKYEDKLIYVAATELTATLEPTVTDTPTLQPVNETSTVAPTVMPDGEVSAAPSETAVVEENYVDLASLYSNDSFDISYEGYKLYDSYPESSQITDFTLDAQNGNKLFIAEFKIKNITDQKQKIKLSTSDLKYQLAVNDEAKYNAAITPLLNDIQYLEVSIGANKSKSAVVVFEISEDLDLSKVILYVSKSDVIAEIKIK